MASTAQVPLLDVSFGLTSPPKSYEGKKGPHESYGNKKGPHSLITFSEDTEPLTINIPAKSYGGKRAPSSGLIPVLDDDSASSKLSCVKKGTIANLIVVNEDEHSYTKSHGSRKLVPAPGLGGVSESDDNSTTVGINTNSKKTESDHEAISLDAQLKTSLQQHGAKRGASGPLVTTSDEESSDSLPPSPRSNVTSSSSVHQHAYEHDHDYENVASPSGSSTASGPVYIRPPGFKHHAHEIKNVKKKKTTSIFDLKSALKKRAPTPPKVKPRKEPVPMRLRALPQSFWKQPNLPNPVSPAPMFPSLPPLGSKDTGEDISEVRPITPPDEKDRLKKQPRQPERKVIVTGDTDLLLKHLFDRVSEEKKSSSQMKRGRPRKTIVPKATNTKALMTGDDPYLVEAVTEKFFPQLSLECRQAQSGVTSLQVVTLREGDKAVTLPSLSIEQNYSQMLSDLAMNI